MDFNALVEEIVARVAEKLDNANEAENPQSIAETTEKTADCGRPKLLILSQSHGTHCHQMLESKRLTAKFATECALTKDFDCDISEYAAVILYHLSNEALMKIAEGNGDTPYTALAVRAILMGKKVIAVREEVELFDYKSTAPAVYYGMMMDKVKLLERSGVVFCERNAVEDTLLGEKASTAAPAPAAPCACTCEKPAEGKAVTVSKKVITEKDVTAAHSEGATILRVGAKAIVTDLAKDYAHERNIEIIKG